MAVVANPANPVFVSCPPKRSEARTVAHLLPEIVIDIFAGGGGDGEGIRQATGRGPDVAINHCQEALAVHHANFPGTYHLCQDVWKVDPRSTAAGRRVGLLWASPDCSFFSRAKSGKPLDKKVRELAWGVVLWAKRVKPRVIVVENVPEFVNWGPLNGEGHPIKARRGQTFRRWVRELEREGYAVEWRVLDAADYGAAMSRERFFAIARLDGSPVWPAATHGIGLLPRRSMAECIDWTIPMRDVYGRLAEKTIARIEKGIERFVIGLHGPEHVRLLPDGSKQAAFIAQHNLGQVGKPLSCPLPSITTRDSHALVTVEMDPSASGSIIHEGKRYAVGEVQHRMLWPHELAAAIGFPKGYQLIGSKEQRASAVGHAVSPVVAAALVRSNYVPG